MPDDRDTRKIPEDTVIGVTEPAAPLDVSFILVPGAVVDGRFEIVSLLGKGGMCTVYKANHLTMDRIVALKMLNEKLVIDKDAMERFQREAKAISALEHPNIVKVYGFGAVGRVPFMAMEYLEGISLADLLKQEQRLSKERALPIFSQILDALGHAHERGIIHRDLKPSNVMLVVAENCVKLVDFGIAKILPESGKQLQKLTQTGDLFGTVLYMSPEQCSGVPLDARSDLYSMGCLMYEVLDGNPPLQGDAPYATMAKHLYESPRASDYLADDFGSVVLSLLEKDPAQRPQSAIELNAALSNPASFVRRHIPKEKKQKSNVSKWAMLLCTVIIIVAIVWIFPKHGQNVDTVKTAPQQAQYDRTERELESALARHENASHPDNQQILEHLDNLTLFYMNHSKWAEAEPLFKRALAIREKVLGLNNRAGANSLIELAYCYSCQGKSTEATPLYKRALAILEKDRGTDDPDVLTNMARSYMGQNKFTEAESLYKRVLAIREKAPNNPHVDYSLMDLAKCYFEQGKCAQAELLYKRALAIREKALGPNNLDVASSLNGLATNYLKQGKYAQAELLYKRALAIREKALGPNNLDVASSLNGLATNNLKQAKYAQAELLYKRGLAIDEKALGVNHPNVLRDLNNLAGLYKTQGKTVEAKEWEAKAEAISAVKK